MSFTFAQPYWLLLLLLLPLLAWWRGRMGQHQPAFLYSSIQLVRPISSITRSQSGAVLRRLRWLALALFIVAMARPQLGQGETKISASGIDIVVALDLSDSMKSLDFKLKGQPVSRLALEKDVLEKFIQGRPGDRIGFVAFATDAYVAAPMTLDHDFLLQNLSRLEIGVIKANATAIGSGLAAAVNRLRNSKSKSKIVILMTDGQNNAGKVPPLTAADAAAALGVKVYTIGVGIRGMADYPYVDAFGRTQLIKEPVDIDEDTLKKISEKTHAYYYRADTSDAMRKIYTEIDQLEKSTVEVKKYQHYRELFMWLIAPGLALLCMEIVLGQTVLRKLP